MNALGSLAYALGLIPGTLAIVGNLRGGPWALGATILGYGNDSVRNGPFDLNV